MLFDPYIQMLKGPTYVYVQTITHQHDKERAFASPKGHHAAQYYSLLSLV